jgi:hypothetical protein
MSVITPEALVIKTGEPLDGHVLIPRIGASKFLRGQRFNLQGADENSSYSVIDDVSAGLVVFANTTCGGLALECTRECPEREPMLRRMLEANDAIAATALCRSMLAEYLQQLACAEYQQALWYGDELACAMEMLDLLSHTQPQPRY